MTLSYSAFYQFQKVSEGDDSVIIVFEYSLSLRTIIINAQRTVGIFLMKQTIAIFRWRNRACSININLTDWVDDDDNVINDNGVINDSDDANKEIVWT